MDTQKLYSWAKQQDMNIGVLEDENEIKEAKDLNAALQEKQINDIGINMSGNEHVSGDDAVDAPIVDHREKVPAHMPPSMDVFCRKQSLIRSGNYSFLSKKGVMMKGTRSTPSKKYMKPILDNLESLDNIFAEKFDPGKKDVIQDLFRKTIIACENYIDNRNPWTSEGKARLQMIKHFYVQMRSESIMFAGRVEALSEDEIKASATKTWLDVLTAVRTDNIENEKDGYKVQEGGAGTSKVYIIEKDGKKEYFKENEKCPAKDLFILMDEPIKKLSEEQDDKSKRRLHYLKEIKRVIMEKYKTEAKASVELKKAYKKDNKLYAFIIAMFGGDAEIKKMMLEIMERENSQLEGKDSDMDFINKELEEMMKKKTLSVIATRDAQIQDRSEISKRNVATSRLADYLQIGDMVAKSKLVKLSINGKQMNGISMEEAKGETLPTITKEAEKNNKKVKYSPKAYKQLLNLQLFDVICGQVDRNMGNYLCEKEETGDTVEITQIKAIDNDISFGNLVYEEIYSNGLDGLNRMRNIEYVGELHVPAVDKLFADRILALDEKTINYLMCDVLSRSERAALMDRIDGVKRALRTRMNAEAKSRNKKKIFLDDKPQSWKESLDDLTKDVANSLEKDKKQIEKLQKELVTVEKNKSLEPEDKQQRLDNLTKKITDLKGNTTNRLLQKSYLWSICLSNSNDRRPK